MSLRDDILLRSSLQEAESVLEEIGFPLEEETPESELFASEARSWFRYNVAMTGRVPLIDEERGVD